MKSLAILGSTGSIGCSTLKIVSQFPDKFMVKALTAKSNLQRLADQIALFEPELAVVHDAAAARRLKKLLPAGRRIEILFGGEGYCLAAAWDGVDMVVGAMVGAAGLAPTLAAIRAGKDIALANKEPLVMAGPLVMAAADRWGARLLPIDSEHSAIFQCLRGHRREDLDKIVLTASGGPFLDIPAAEFDTITPQRACKHPNWDMGAKITIDSATLMNKGLEVIEAQWLFDLRWDQIEVIVHPQSIIHSMVAYRDGSILAQMGTPEMRAAIAYALSYPERIALRQALPDLVALGGLFFQDPDLQKFPCLQLAFDACAAGGTMPTVLNAANEIAVAAFLDQQIPFTAIAEVIDATMGLHSLEKMSDLEAVMAADGWARRRARSKVAALRST